MIAPAGDRPEHGSDAILELNLSALSKRFPELAALIAASPAAPLEILLSASGDASARNSGGAWIHSSRDPKAEARRIAQAAFPGSGADTAVLLGFGLGYLAEAIAFGCADYGVEHIIACEADPDALAAAFRIRDFSSLVADERLGFVVGGESEGIITALELSGGQRAAILELKAAIAADPAWFERSRSAAERWNAKGAVNENTLRLFGRLWVRNLARNLGAAADSPGVELLEGLFEGIPALVLAAGPSLDLVLPHVKELSRRAIIVCVDTALRSLLRFGVEPDFLVLVDPQYWNWRHIAGLSSPSSFLVSETTAWPAVFRATRRGAFLGGSLFPLGRRIEAFAGSKGHLGAGGSVATSAWDLCRIMGCAPVWMAGLDLGYPGGQTHARASLFEQRALASGSRLKPAAAAQAAALVGGGSFEAKAAGGGNVRTDQRMTLYAWWFESRFARPASPPTIGLSRGGLAMPGMGLGGVDELLSCPERRREIAEGLERAEAMARPEIVRAQTAAGFAEGFAALRAQLESIARNAEAALEAAREGRSAFSSGGDCGPCLAALDRADALLIKLEAREVAGFLLPPLSEMVGSGARDLGESLMNSEKLYRSLAESARYHLEVLACASFSD